jgi:hypothetical protein
MKRHLDRKIKCSRIILSYKYDENNLDQLSLETIKEEHIVICKYNEIMDNMVLDNNIDKDHYISYIDHNNCTECVYCKKAFFRKYELKRHILKGCKMNELDKVCYNIKNEQTNINQSINNQQINNQQINNQHISSQHINNQQINNISINLYNSPNITPFDNEWDVTDIDVQKKILLFLADNKYSKTMEEILKNNKNLNILFDKNSDSGLIYKNDIDKFTSMKSDEIIISIIYKLYSHLNNFYEDIKNNDFILSELDIHKDTIEQKYNDFNDTKDNNIKNYVKNILIDIFEKYKDKIIEQFLEFDKYISTNDQIGF